MRKPRFLHAQTPAVVFLQHEAEKLQSGGRAVASADDSPGGITYILLINEAPQKTNNSGAIQTGTEHTAEWSKFGELKFLGRGLNKLRTAK
jgi:hypothetical protein